MVYRSKKDFWMPAAVWSAVLLTLGAGVLVYLAADAAFGRELVLAAAAAAVAVLVLSYPLHYELTDTQLVARCGVMRWRVALASVEEVRPCRSLLSAPAWSSDRLRVTYREGPDLKSLDIAPEDKRRFLSDLAGAAPGLAPRGDGVVRVA